MGSVHPIRRTRPFDPETAESMGQAFDTAWQALMLSGSGLVASFRAEATREALALRIIDAVQLGERDVGRLRDDAIAHVQQLAAATVNKAAPQRQGARG